MFFALFALSLRYLQTKRGEVPSEGLLGFLSNLMLCGKLCRTRLYRGQLVCVCECVHVVVPFILFERLFTLSGVAPGGAVNRHVFCMFSVCRYYNETYHPSPSHEKGVNWALLQFFSASPSSCGACLKCLLRDRRDHNKR